MKAPANDPVWRSLLSRGRVLIGMVHVGALPGTPNASHEPVDLASLAADEARDLAQAGFDAVIVENMHDAPYVHGDALGPEIVAAMTLAVGRVRDAVDIPVGVQILSGGNRHALGVAKSTGASFVRCENFVFAHTADEGLLPVAEAGPLLRYRRSIGAEHVGVFCDIKKKHASHAITGDLTIEEVAQGAAFFGADALIVTGPATGRPADMRDLEAVARATTLPVLVGSGVQADSVPALFEHARALIVGSAVKHDGHWRNRVDPRAAERIVHARDAMR
ncbi:MAG: BtpA/SgcQ family protein [Phycisphaerales bacterium]